MICARRSSSTAAPVRSGDQEGRKATHHHHHQRTLCTRSLPSRTAVQPLSRAPQPPPQKYHMAHTTRKPNHPCRDECKKRAGTPQPWPRFTRPSLRTTHGTANGQRRYQQRRPEARKVLRRFWGRKVRWRRRGADEPHRSRCPVEDEILVLEIAL